MSMNDSLTSAKAACKGSCGKQAALLWFALWLLFSLCIPRELPAGDEWGVPFIRNYLQEEYRGSSQNWG